MNDSFLSHLLEHLLSLLVPFYTYSINTDSVLLMSPAQCLVLSILLIALDFTPLQPGLLQLSPNLPCIQSSLLFSCSSCCCQVIFPTQLKLIGSLKSFSIISVELLDLFPSMYLITDAYHGTYTTALCCTCLHICHVLFDHKLNEGRYICP